MILLLGGEGVLTTAEWSTVEQDCNMQGAVRGEEVGADITMAVPNMLEILPRGINKWVGMQLLLQDLQARQFHGNIVRFSRHPHPGGKSSAYVRQTECQTDWNFSLSRSALLGGIKNGKSWKTQ